MQNFRQIYDESIRIFDLLDTQYPSKIVDKPKQDLKYTIGDRVVVFLCGKYEDAIIRAIDPEVFDEEINMAYYVQILGKNALQEIGEFKTSDDSDCYWVGEDKTFCKDYHILQNL